MRVRPYWLTPVMRFPSSVSSLALVMPRYLLASARWREIDCFGLGKKIGSSRRRTRTRGEEWLWTANSPSQSP